MISLKNLFEALSANEKAKVDKWERGDNSFSDHAFRESSDKDKVYVDLDKTDGNSTHKLEIETHLKKHGYKLSDYRKGIAKDKYGRDTNIGKALEKTKADSLLKKNFQTDPDRQQQKSINTDDYHVMISRHPHDVAGMTSGKHCWRKGNCMDFNRGENKKHLESDVKHGTHVAYLKHKNDVDNEEPLARIALKKYTNVDDEKDHILRPENKTYGSSTPHFAKAVDKWAKSHFKEKDNGIYKKHDSVYDDTNTKYYVGKGAVDKAIEHPDPKVQAAAARSEHTKPEHIDKLMDNKNPLVRTTLLRHNPNLNKTHIKRIMNSPSESDKEDIRNNKHINIDKILNEDVAINSVGTGNVAGIGVGKDPEPGIKKKNTFINFKSKLKRGIK